MAADLEQQIRALATQVVQCYQRGDYAQALALAQEAYRLSGNLPDPEHPLLATSLNNLATLYHDMGDYAAAQPLYAQALELRRRVLGPDHPDVATSLNNLATLFVATHRPAEGLVHMDAATAIDHRMLGQIFSCGSETQRMTYLQTLQWNLYAFLSLILQSFSASPEALAMALELILRRKALGAEALSIQREAVLGGQYPALAPTLQHLHILRMQIAQKTLAGPGPEGLAAHHERLAAWHAEKDRLEAELARQIPEMHLERRLRAVDRQVVALALPEGTTLVECVRFPVYNFHAVPAHGDSRWDPARYVAFVLPAGDPDHVQMIDLGEAEPIDRMIATYRAYLMGEAETHRQAGAAPEPGAALGRALRAALFDPVATALHDGWHDLFLAPDGALTQLPFEVLPLDDGRFLADTVQITYLSAGRDVLHFGTDISTTPPHPPDCRRP